MSIIHVNQIKTRIAALFDSKLDLTDATGPDRDNHMLTRSLAAYAVHYLSGTDVETSAKSVVDGGNDNGIDAIYYDPAKKVLFLVQSKWIHDGRGEPENGDVKKFVAGVRDLFNLSFDRFNKKVQAKQSEVKQALEDPETRYQVVIAYTGINGLAEPSRRDLKDLEDEVNDASEMVTVVCLNQTGIHKSLASGIAGDPINLQIGLRYWGKVESPYLAFYGQVNGSEVATWWEKYRTRLFHRNLRNALGDTEVNAEIKKTIDKEPDRFWYFNNGITLIAQKAAKTMAGGADRDLGNFHCEDISIVNGAQTVTTIGRVSEVDPKRVGQIFLPIRIIAVGDAHELGEQITRANNRQNKIENRDFVRQDPEQIRIQTELAIDKVEYNLMRSDSPTAGANSFDLVASTIALASATGEARMAVQVKREIGKLWEDLTKSPYKELFNPTVSGLYVWRCVRVQRLIDSRIGVVVHGLGTGSGRDFGVAVHGNRMIAAKVFRALNSKDFQNPKFDFDAKITDVVVSQQVDQSYAALKADVARLFGGSILPTLFKNASKCKQLI